MGAVALVVGAGVVAVPAGASAAAGRAALAGSVASVANSEVGTAAVPSAESHTVQVWLAGDEAAAQSFVDGVSTPGSASFHQYLSPAAFTQRFGASPRSAAAVRSWLSSQGMSDVSVGPGREYVSATGSTTSVDRAFHTQMRTYLVAGARGARTSIESNDSALSIPASLASDVLSVTGLNSTPLVSQSVPAPTASPTLQCSRFWGQHTVALNPALNGLTEAATPVCGYTADQMRAAYGETMANDGQGVTIALPEVGSQFAMGPSLRDYAHVNGLPEPSPAQFREQRLKGAGRCFVGSGQDDEEHLDSESAYAMAPGADQLMVFATACERTGEDPDEDDFDAQLAPLIGVGGHPSASIESISEALAQGSSTPTSAYATQHAILLRADAEGVGMYFSSGDSPGLSESLGDPDATEVGGTTLGIGDLDQVLFQTGWSDDLNLLIDGAWQDVGLTGAAGGGASPVYDEPAYQEGVVPTTLSDVDGRMARTVPDISADGDGQTGMLFGGIVPASGGVPRHYVPFAEGGTSMAAPLVAGMVADAQQGQPRPFGFINPLLYSLSGTPAINDVLPLSASLPQTDRNAYTDGLTSSLGGPVDYQFGVTAPLADGGQEIAPGYDTVTGLGTPNGQAFVAALRSRSTTGAQPSAR